MAENVTRLIDRLPDRAPRPELAARMGIGDKTLGFIRSGTGNPTLENIAKVAAFLRVKTWELLVPAADQAAEHVPLESEEAEMLELFRLASPDMRAAMVASARASLARSSDASMAELIQRLHPTHRKRLMELGVINESAPEQSPQPDQAEPRSSVPKAKHD
ncbi:helix-turn-helix domain-containing protein [Lysobacter capsici]|uniref:helix-turn-helix domain-containing protein n=1 Tax=Lysobacter capsici TaxID=435897 RepID=UPI001651689F|nr:helix-turn-helix transcriptional regulator [Lysobacter capsici]